MSWFNVKGDDGSFLKWLLEPAKSLLQMDRQQNDEMERVGQFIVNGTTKTYRLVNKGIQRLKYKFQSKEKEKVQEQEKQVEVLPQNEAEKELEMIVPPAEEPSHDMAQELKREQEELFAMDFINEMATQEPSQSKELNRDRSFHGWDR